MGSRLLVCARPATPGEVDYGSERAQVGVGPWEHEVVGRAALSSELCGGVSKLVAHDACMAGCNG